jgi:hypothetical protein
LLSSDVLSKILDWNLIAWKFKWKDQPKNRDADEWIAWFELSHNLNSTIKKIGERAIAEHQYYLSTFFLKNFKKHVEASKNENMSVGPQGNAKKRYYVEELFRIFYQLVFEKVAGTNESDYFWENVPEEWKVTKSNIVSKEGLIARVSLHEFLEWATRRIDNNPDFDLRLNNSTNNLFPEVEPSVWAAILIFVLTPYSSENRVKSVVERNWSFGYRLKPLVISFGENSTEEALGAAAETEKQQRLVETKNACELALLLFRQTFTKELLKQYIKEAEELKYDEKSNPRECHRRLRLFEVFKALLSEHSIT